MFAENLDVFVRDFGVPLVKAGYAACLGLFDTPDETMNMAGVNLLSTMYVVEIKTSDAQARNLGNGDSVTVNGAAFIVRDVMLKDDGAFTAVTLSKV